MTAQVWVQVNPHTLKPGDHIRATRGNQVLQSVTTAVSSTSVAVEFGDDTTRLYLDEGWMWEIRRPRREPGVAYDSDGAPLGINWAGIVGDGL